MRSLSSRRSGAGLPDLAGSAGAREDPGGPGKPGCCEALMKKVTGGWSSGGVDRPDSLSRRGRLPARAGLRGKRPAPWRRWLRTGCSSGRLGGAWTQECYVDGALCIQLEVNRGGGVLLFLSQKVTNGVLPGWGLRRSLLCARPGSKVGGTW